MTDHSPPLRIGSVCTGYGGLDAAVRKVFGGAVVWHCQYEPPGRHGREDKQPVRGADPGPPLARVPNHGDLTAIDFRRVEPVDIFTAGFPCQDVSLAGRPCGASQTVPAPDCGCTWPVPSNILRPRLVVIENVEGLLSAPG